MVFCKVIWIFCACNGLLARFLCWVWQEIFNQAAPPFQEALKKSGYDYKLTKNPTPKEKRKPAEMIFWILLWINKYEVQNPEVVQQTLLAIFSVAMLSYKGSSYIILSYILYLLKLSSILYGFCLIYKQFNVTTMKIIQLRPPTFEESLWRCFLFVNLI